MIKSTVNKLYKIANTAPLSMRKWIYMKIYIGLYGRWHHAQSLYYVTLAASRFQFSPLFARFFSYCYLLNRSCYASQTKTNWLRNLPSMQLVGLQARGTTSRQVTELLRRGKLNSQFTVTDFSILHAGGRSLFRFQTSKRVQETLGSSSRSPRPRPSMQRSRGRGQSAI